MGSIIWHPRVHDEIHKTRASTRSPTYYDCKKFTLIDHQSRVAKIVAHQDKLITKSIYIQMIKLKIPCQYFLWQLNKILQLSEFHQKIKLSCNCFYKLRVIKDTLIVHIIMLLRVRNVVIAYNFHLVKVHWGVSGLKLGDFLQLSVIATSMPL